MICSESDAGIYEGNGKARMCGVSQNVGGVLNQLRSNTRSPLSCPNTRAHTYVQNTETHKTAGKHKHTT